MDLAPEDAFISLSTLETYIEKYPEDAEKWLEFLHSKENTQPRNRRHMLTRDRLPAELLEPHVNTIIPNTESPIEDYNDGCLLCKKSWTSTDGVPKITLICGHMYHTVCYMYEYYANETPVCLVQDCDIDTWAYIRTIYRNNRDRRNRAENILLESFKKRADFKEDIRQLRSDVFQFTRAQATMDRLIDNAKKDLAHKHLFTINYLRKEMNTTVKDLQETEEMLNYKNSIRKFRKHATKIFRKYHTSFRELNTHGIIKSSWRVRGVLERHRQISFYKLGFGTYPGLQAMKDPLANQENNGDSSSDELGEAEAEAED